MIVNLPSGVKCFEINTNYDQRGMTYEIFRDDNNEYININMGYLSWTLPKQSRGPHEHSEQSDLFIFAGPGTFELCLWDIRHVNTDELTVELAKEIKFTYIVGESNKVKLSIPPGIVHGYKNISEIPGLVLNFPDELYRGWKKGVPPDEKKWELEKDNPFLML